MSIEYDLKINERNEKEQKRISFVYKKLKHIIGDKIFSTAKIWQSNKEELNNNLYISRKIYDDLFNDDYYFSFSNQLKTELSKGHHYAINDVIANEYSEILKLINELDDLKRELRHKQYHIESLEKNYNELHEKFYNIPKGN